MNYGEKLRYLRSRRGLSQKELTDRLQINRSTYARYETSATQPDFDTLSRLADFFDVTIDYLLGRSESASDNQITIAGQEINLTAEELQLFNELKKHPVMFHDLASDPEKKVKELLKMYKMKKMFLEEDEEDYGDGFGDLED